MLGPRLIASRVPQIAVSAAFGVLASLLTVSSGAVLVFLLAVWMYATAASFTVASLWELVADTRDRWVDRHNTTVDAHTAAGLMLVGFPTVASFAGYFAWNSHWFLLVHGSLVGIALFVGILDQFTE